MKNNFFDNSNQHENNQNIYGGNSYQSYNNGFSDGFSNEFGNSAYNDYAESKNSYPQNQPPMNSTYNGYNQGNNDVSNSYVDNSGYMNNGYQNNQIPYNNPNFEGNGYNYLDSSDPAGADVIYAKENSNDRLRDIIFILFFAAFAVMIFASLVSENTAFGSLVTTLTPFLFVGVFLSIFIVPIIYTMVNNSKKSRRCTQQVVAKIVDVRTIYSSSGHKSNYPTYKYYYNGKIYIVSSTNNKFVVDTTVGNEIPLRINPQEPTEFFIDSKKNSVATGCSLLFIGYIVLSILVPLIIITVVNSMFSN
ncbi:MAG: DUF3592 domain-containing protein [Acutalibacteraceae bacterium]|nr:DUF3592 domain-containing protein [Acutalibacteraceae bacterium]